MIVKMALDSGVVGGDYFVLDDPVKGVLDNTTYLLAPDDTEVDVTEYVRKVTVKRGRSRVLSHFTSAAVNLELLNTDRRFDPAYAPSTASRTNLATNPSFEVNATGWTAQGAGAAQSRITTDSLFGSACLQITKAAATNQGSACAVSGLAAATSYAVSVRVKVPVGMEAAGLYVTLTWRDAALATITSVSTTTTTVASADGWVTISTVATSPALTDNVVVFVRQQAAGTVNHTFLIDSLCMEAASSAGAYFDGTSADGSIRLTAQAWNGTADASTSTISHYVDGTGSPYYGAIRPRKQVTIDESGYPIATVLTEDWNFDYDRGGMSTALPSCVDGFAVLASQECVPGVQVEQLSSARINAVLDAVGYGEGRAISTGQATVGADTIAAEKPLLAYLQLVEASEQGALFMSKAGLLTFKSRDDLQNVLASAPKVSRLNRVTNPSFEVNTTGWTDMGGMSRVTSDFARGVACAQFAYAGAGTAGLLCAAAVTPGMTYTVSAYMKHSAAVAATTVLNIVWRNSVGATVLDDAHLSLAAATSWSRVSQTRTAPATAVEALVRFYRTVGESGGATPVNVLVDAVMMEEASTVQPYFDGDASDANGSVVQAWTGAAHASTSIQYVYTPVVFGPSGIPFMEIGVAWGTEELATKATVTHVGGAVVAEDVAASNRLGGPVEAKVDTVLAAGADAGDLAEWIVGRYSTPQYRVDSVKVNLWALTSPQREAILGLELGDAVKVVWTPNNVGSAISQYLVVDGIEHEITPGAANKHLVTFTFSETIGSFILDSSEFGVLDENVLGY